MKDIAVRTIRLCGNLAVNQEGHLLFAGQDTLKLAAQYGTPLYLMDEDRVRENMHVYKRAFRKTFREGSRVLYASKANSFREIYRICAQEGLGADVVSAGEILTAQKAGFPMEDTCFHGNAKTDGEIALAMETGVGVICLDNLEEIAAVEAEAARRGIVQRVLLRLTPGIDPHTYAAVDTGQVDSKFGFAIGTGQADEALETVLGMKHMSLDGFHCHVGSQVFDEDVFCRSAAVMLEYMASARERYGYTAEVLDLGGGYGVPYVESDGTVDLEARIGEVGEVVRSVCARLSFPEPRILMEPGRSIVADAGLTLYTVCVAKTIPGYRTYVSVDGGMTDNPRFALYGARYTCLAAGRMNERAVLPSSVVGRCCESGDIIQENVAMPASIQRGDILAVCTTGAYNYSMASNYNRVPRPPIVMLRDGESRVAVRRETDADLLRLDE